MKTCNNCANYKPKRPSPWQAQSTAMRWTGTGANDLTHEPSSNQIHYPPVVTQPGARIETPIAQQTVESGVKVPLMQSVVTGGLFGSMTACIVFYLEVPKPVLIIAASALYATYNAWKGGVNIADSLLTRIEDYTGIDINRDGVTGSERVSRQVPTLRLIKSKSGYGVTETNKPDYVPTPNEQIMDIPNWPRFKEDPMTVERLTALLEQAFTTQRWGRKHYKELGISQGQWSVLSKYLGLGEDKKGHNIWGTTSRPALDDFVEQVSVPVNQPTGLV